jgi:hypothetical protein
MNADESSQPETVRTSRFGMLTRIFAFAAGFFVYVANLLCFVQVPPQMSKPLLASSFAVTGVVCAVIALALRRFDGWQRTLAIVLIGGSLMSVLAVATIALLRSSTTVTHAMYVSQLGGFTDYKTGSVVTLSLLVAGVALLWASRRKA